MSYSSALTTPKGVEKWLIFSLPSTNEYQEIIGLKSAFIKKIKEAKTNKIITIRLNDVKETEDILLCSFRLKTKEVVKTFNQKWFVKDYKKNTQITKDDFINGSDRQLKVIKKKLADPKDSLFDIVCSAYNFSLDYLSYGNPIDGLHTFRQALEERITDCGGYSTLIASLLASYNIPTRIVSGFIIDRSLTTTLSSFNLKKLNFNNLLMHAWLEVLLPDGTWFPLDGSIEWKRKYSLSTRQGGFGYIPADRLVVSFGHNFKLLLNNKEYSLPILQKPQFL